MKIAVIGGGVSGLSVARLLGNRHDVVVFEKEDKPGGLIRCRRINGSLFHTCGGHVFNSKRQDVLEWFWSHFSKKEDFVKANRNSVILMDDSKVIPYPIENHIYLFDEVTQRSIINDLIQMVKTEGKTPKNFEEFLRKRFGDTLYRIYFKPYNEKVWRRDLTQVPLTWLEGKLPMPTTSVIFYNNMNHIEEKDFVHSSFWYEKRDGSQWIADRLSQGLNIRYNTTVENISLENGKWTVASEQFDKVIFCGNIKDLFKLIGRRVERFKQPIASLEYHGTTAVFCEIDKNPYSWIYQPSCEHDSHRIICTGSFANSNNDTSVANDRITATIEFTDEISKDSIFDNLKHIPFHPKYLDHQYSQYTYPIQDRDTRDMIKELKRELAPLGFFFTGRFADWEYYNMDAAIGAAMDTIKEYRL